MKANLFVYGSLQPGGPNHHRLTALAGEWQQAVIRGHLQQQGWGAQLGYPGLVLDEHGERITGHVLSCANLSDFLDELDAFEGKEYQRVTAPVVLNSGERIHAYVYVLKSPVR